MKPRILVVDDHKDTRDLLAVTLAAFGCETVLAADGKAALQILEAESSSRDFQAIFLDVMMPELTGYDVIEKVKDNPDTSEIPVVMLTAKGGDDDILRGYNSGADYYIPKPFSSDQIAFGLEMVLGDEMPVSVQKSSKKDSGP